MSSGGLSRARLDRMHEVLMTQRAGFPQMSPVYLDFWTSVYQAIDD